VSEVRLDRERRRNHAARQPRPSLPKRMGRRETPCSPVSWSRVQACRPRARRKPRRDAGSSRGAGTRSQAVGSRSRSYASCSFSAASRKADRRKGELARSELPHRWRGEVVGSEKELGFGRGSSPRGETHGEVGSAEALVQAGARAKRCAKRAPRRQTCGIRVRVCLVPQGIRSTWLKCHADMRKLTGQTTRQKASWVAPPVSPEVTRGRSVGPSWSGG